MWAAVIVKGRWTAPQRLVTPHHVANPFSQLTPHPPLLYAPPWPLSVIRMVSPRQESGTFGHKPGKMGESGWRKYVDWCKHGSCLKCCMGHNYTYICSLFIWNSHFNWVSCLFVCLSLITLLLTHPEWSRERGRGAELPSYWKAESSVRDRFLFLFLLFVMTGSSLGKWEQGWR